MTIGMSGDNKPAGFVGKIIKAIEYYATKIPEICEKEYDKCMKDVNDKQGSCSEIDPSGKKAECSDKLSNKQSECEREAEVEASKCGDKYVLEGGSKDACLGLASDARGKCTTDYDTNKAKCGDKTTFINTAKAKCTVEDVDRLSQCDKTYKTKSEACDKGPAEKKEGCKNEAETFKTQCVKTSDDKTKKCESDAETNASGGKEKCEQEALKAKGTCEKAADDKTKKCDKADESKATCQEKAESKKKACGTKYDKSDCDDVFNDAEDEKKKCNKDAEKMSTDCDTGKVTCNAQKNKDAENMKKNAPIIDNICKEYGGKNSRVSSKCADLATATEDIAICERVASGEDYSECITDAYNSILSAMHDITVIKECIDIGGGSPSRRCLYKGGVEEKWRVGFSAGTGLGADNNVGWKAGLRAALIWEPVYKLILKAEALYDLGIITNDKESLPVEHSVGGGLSVGYQGGNFGVYGGFDSGAKFTKKAKGDVLGFFMPDISLEYYIPSQESSISVKVGYDPIWEEWSVMLFYNFFPSALSF